VLWFFLTVSVDSSFVPLPDFMAEHRTYLPSVGMLIALVCLADTARTFLSRWPHLRPAVPGIVGCAVVALCVATIQRNKVWSTNVSFWSDTVAKSPDKFRPWKNLGVAYTHQNQLEKAIGCFRRAIELSPRSLEAYFGLANALIGGSRYREGLEAAEAGLRIKEHAGLYYFMGIALRQLGEEPRAAESLLKAVALDPAHGPSHAVLAVVFVTRGDFNRAAAHAKTAATVGGLTPPMWQLVSEVEATTRIRISSP
jgi:tetratricopeptide (TPR) repeat protein